MQLFLKILNSVTQQIFVGPGLYLCELKLNIFAVSIYCILLHGSTVSIRPPLEAMR